MQPCSPLTEAESLFTAVSVDLCGWGGYLAQQDFTAPVKQPEGMDYFNWPKLFSTRVLRITAERNGLVYPLVLVTRGQTCTKLILLVKCNWIVLVLWTAGQRLAGGCPWPEVSKCCWDGACSLMFGNYSPLCFDTGPDDLWNERECVHVGNGTGSD